MELAPRMEIYCNSNPQSSRTWTRLFVTVSRPPLYNGHYVHNFMYVWESTWRDIGFTLGYGTCMHVIPKMQFIFFVACFMGHCALCVILISSLGPLYGYLTATKTTISTGLKTKTTKTTFSSSETSTRIRFPGCVHFVSLWVSFSSVSEYSSPRVHLWILI